jgi:carboxyl-terminal processing protease
LIRAWTTLAIAVVALFAGIWIGGHPGNLPGPVRDVLTATPAAQSVSTSTEALELIEDRYFRKTSPDQLSSASIRGMIRDLRRRYGDRFSHYFDPEQMARLTEALQGSFSGVGMTVAGKDRKGLEVGSVFKGTPAARAGLERGDLIVSVNGDSIRKETVETVVALIKGPAGTEVTLGVRSPGRPRSRQITLTREEIELPVTVTRTVRRGGKKLGYVRFGGFSEGSSLKLKKALERVRGRDVEGIVLDLRGNGGGLLPEAVLVSSLFVPKGKVVVETSSRTRGDETFKAVGGEIELPRLVVLVDRGTASAAEILAAALRDEDGVSLIGTRTFGKGLFQEVIDLSNGGALDLTVGEFLTAEGRSLAGKGLKPDVTVEPRPGSQRDVQLDRAYRVLGAELAGNRP